MEPETISLIQAILELGWPAVVLMQSIILYRAYTAMTDRYLAHLERISERVTTLTQPLVTPPFLDDAILERRLAGIESARSDALS